MRLSLSKAVAAISLAALHWSAQASLVSPLEYETGGLTWLKLSETSGLSLNDFDVGVDGWNTKYRFELDSEIDALIASFGLSLGDSGYQKEGFGAAEFNRAVGGMSADGTDGTYFAGGNFGSLGRGLGRFIHAEMINGDAPVALGPNCPAYYSCSRFNALAAPQPLNRGAFQIGLFLVRDDRIAPPPVSVPEPGSLALVSAAALLAVARRKRAP